MQGLMNLLISPLLRILQLLQLKTFVISTTILNQGDTYQYSITEQLTHIYADKNVYVNHMSGYGCELGSAILPPLNCAGSSSVSFPRTNSFSFLLNIVCPVGSEGDFCS